MAAPLTPHPDPVLQAKAGMRQVAIARRAAWLGDRTSAASAAATHFLKTIPLAPGAIVSGYAAMKDELDPEPLLATLAGRGHEICLPVVVGRDQPLLFRRWRPGEKLIAGPKGTRHPQEGARPVTPDVLVVPLLAFDRAGRRLGFGAGYYDRTLLKLRADRAIAAVGFAFEAQGVERVPTGPADQTLDWIVTEKGAKAVT